MIAFSCSITGSAGANVSGSSIAASAWAAELLATGKMQINGLTSKAGKQYNAIFYMEPGEQYVNFRMEFAPRTAPSAPQPAASAADPAHIPDTPAQEQKGE